MASVPHQQDGSTAPQRKSIIDTMTSTSFATSLLQAGKLTSTDHETLVALINHDISTATHKDALTLSISGHISIRLRVSHRKVEAVAAVFNTAELLEAILIHLPATSLVLDVPLVCKGFREAVQDSQKLQRRMYRPLDSAPDHQLDVFGATVAGFEFAADDYGTYLRIYPWAMKSSSPYDGLRSRQLSRPVIKSATLNVVGEQDVDERVWATTRVVFDLSVQSDRGITFGDLLNIVEHDQRSRHAYEFFMSDTLVGDGSSSDGWTDLMAGGKLRLGWEIIPPF